MMKYELVNTVYLNCTMKYEVINTVYVLKLQEADPFYPDPPFHFDGTGSKKLSIICLLILKE